ncbi:MULTISPECIES: TetR/AcrR family transcriptional regulator [Nocardiopsis]|uniref:AcrR family transcriptional regulator n=1 Tax=Nocardiopsis sinuspersici TaxID=501010 RepID=A0A1V3C8S9_9ACTN|nr:MULTISPECIES: TetR/AcrR family transcriptional regulator [Nocardiopsis]NYH53933.1 AcrR family transcriptional regulator [Nocardiopsis sinuspersici]OOC56926.1 TetR family transcriptional regulator [Nocardiopsis sinuspersici]
MPQDTRSSLVASARQLLDSGGIEAVTLREVGRLSGLSHMAPYKHFADKESLLAAVAARELERLGDIIDRAAGQAFTAREALRTVLHSYTAWAMDHPARFSLVFGTWSGPREELGAAARRTRASLTAVVRQCQVDGSLPGGDTERRTALLLAAVHGAVSLAMAGRLSPDRGGTDPDGLVDDLLELLGSAAGKR